MDSSPTPFQFLLEAHHQYFLCASIPSYFRRHFVWVISSKKMVELETVRYLHKTNKSLLYTTNNKILMEHYFPARATTTACIPVNVLPQFSLGLSKALISCRSHTQSLIQTIKVVMCFCYIKI